MVFNYALTRLIRRRIVMDILFELAPGEVPSAEVVAALAERDLTLHYLRALCESAGRKLDDSYAPYSKFNVGAAGYFHSKDGNIEVFTGTNIENAAYSPTTCAETTAILGAKNSGFHKLSVMVVAARPEGDWVAPCGRCRQMMAEVVDPNADALVVLYRGDGSMRGVLFSELFPMAFGPWNLGIDPFDA